MPAPCRFCVANNHAPLPDGSNPPCERDFLTTHEALALLDYTSDDVHCFISNGRVLIGGDWSKEEIKNYMDNSLAIEIAVTDGMARGMKHGICVWPNENPQDCRFFQTNEEKLRAYERQYGKVSEPKYG